jgi:hypothetical protein
MGHRSWVNLQSPTLPGARGDPLSDVLRIVVNGGGVGALVCNGVAVKVHFESKSLNQEITGARFATTPFQAVGQLNSTSTAPPRVAAVPSPRSARTAPPVPTPWRPPARSGSPE